MSISVEETGDDWSTAIKIKLLSLPKTWVKKMIQVTQAIYCYLSNTTKRFYRKLEKKWKWNIQIVMSFIWSEDWIAIFLHGLN